MNAYYALARGRVTLSGAESETMDFYGIPRAENPMINIRPDADLINPCFAFMADEAGMEYWCFVGGPKDFDRNGLFDVPIGAFTEALDDFLRPKALTS